MQAKNQDEFLNQSHFIPCYVFEMDQRNPDKGSTKNMLHQ